MSMLADESFSVTCCITTCTVAVEVAASYLVHSNHIAPAAKITSFGVNHSLLKADSFEAL